ncbi:retrovirus-related pol polyprotein from transposon TNT 1-94 [Tanacetum coccineum]
MDWINDTGASDHMTPNKCLFISTKALKKPIIFHLPDGTSKIVTIVGKVQLTLNLILTDVFYVPEFQLNLLSNSSVSNTPDLTTHDPPDLNVSTQIPLATIPNDNGPTQSRRSTRQPAKPSWLKDFVTPHRANAVSTVQYPLFSASDFKGIPHSHIAFLANAFAVTDPTSFHQANTDDGWIEAMNKELAALEANQTWTLTSLPSVAKLATVRVLIALATAKQWSLHELDVNNAFLHGYINEENYMLPPQGYDKAAKGQVCKLNRSLYGLKQALRQWNYELTKFLVGLGYVQSKHNYSLFVKQKQGTFTAALVYVDDVLITRDSETEIRKYIVDLLSDIGLTAAKPATFLLPTELKLSLNKGTPLEDPSTYRKLVGRLLYLTMTRPDISYAVQHLSQFVSAPKDDHMQAAMHLLRYLKGTVSKVSWKTKKQPTISRSSTEAKYRAMAATTFELL